ncbi:MAG: HPP family protein [Candidatus Nanohaloarchaea archaeon]
MNQLNEISAEQVMNTDPVTVETGQSISSIKNTMEEENLRAVPVLDGRERLQGVIGYRDLIRQIQFNPENTKLSKVMHQPPEFDMDHNLAELAELRINSGRKLMVSMNGKKLAGIISDDEFASALSKSDEIVQVTTKDLYTYDLKTVYEEDSVEEVRHVMLDNGISRLPVIDTGGNLTGIVRSTDILKMIVPREKPKSGGTAGDRHGTEEVNISGGNEKNQMSEITVDQIMNRDPLISEEHKNAGDALDEMIKKGEYEMIFVDDSYPESIVTLKDYLKYAAKNQLRDTVFVNVVGLEEKEERAFVQDIAVRQLRGSLGRKLDQPEELKFRFKEQSETGKKHHYELNVQLVSEFGVTNIEEEGWDMNEVVDRALEQLNKIVRKKKEERSEHR